ncbi:MAG TPA: hypothetical protein PKU80_09855 [Candidatus Limiplasma sp.]|nr:hypothetical protein [Candidatus Limiplasma sp.]
MSEPKKNPVSTKTIWTVVVLVIVVAVAVWAIFTYAVPGKDEDVAPTETVAPDTTMTDVTEAPPADAGTLLVWDNMDYVA